MISNVLLREYDLRANRMRLPELGEEVVKIQPLSLDRCMATAEVELVRRIYRDTLKISVFGCGSERRDGPFDSPGIELKCHIFEFCRFREVDRSWPGPA